MDSVASRILREIGEQLDHDLFPRVENGGIVMPSESAVQSTPGEDTHHEQQRKQRRPETGSRQRSTGRQRPSGGPRKTRKAASDLRTRLEARYKDELTAVARAYPETRVWQEDNGLWLLAESTLLPGLSRTAVLLVRVPYAPAISHAWGFWRHSVAGVTWIGPRHTNYPEGSICAFHREDGTWIVGESLVSLLDLYTLWAVRHLYLEVYDRWPGAQVVDHPFERLSELRVDEQCGCGTPGRLYGDCCRPKDLSRRRTSIAMDFIQRHHDGAHKPPAELVRAARDGSNPPNIDA